MNVSCGFDGVQAEHKTAGKRGVEREYVRKAGRRCGCGLVCARACVCGQDCTVAAGDVAARAGKQAVEGWSAGIMRAAQSLSLSCRCLRRFVAYGAERAWYCITRGGGGDGGARTARRRWWWWCG